MDERNWLELIANESQAVKVMEANRYTREYGLTLSMEEAKLLAAERNNALREQKRVEFGEGILPKLIYAFCDSSFISQDSVCADVEPASGDFLPL